MMTKPLAPIDEPPSFYQRSGCVISAVTAFGLVGVGLMLLIPAVEVARQAARRSQFT